MLGVHDVVGGRALRGKTFVEPQQHGAHLGIQITEPLDKLHGKRRRQRSVLKAAEGGCRSLYGANGPVPSRPSASSSASSRAARL